MSHSNKDGPWVTLLCRCGHHLNDHPGGWESCEHTDGSCFPWEMDDTPLFEQVYDEFAYYCGVFEFQPGMRLPAGFR